MTWQSIAPVGSTERSAAIVKYSANRHGYGGGGQKRNKQSQNEQGQENSGGDRYRTSAVEASTEFKMLLSKLAKDNELMKKAAKNISPGTNSARLIVKAEAIRRAAGFSLTEK